MNAMSTGALSKARRLLHTKSPRRTRGVTRHTTALFFSGLLLGGCLSTGSSFDHRRESTAASRTMTTGRDIVCTYLAQADPFPPDAREVDVWIPLAKTGRGQRILKRDVRSPVPYTIASDPDYGNDILHVALEPPLPERLEVEIDYHVQLLGNDAAAVEPLPTIRGLQRALEARGLLTIDEEIRAKAKLATAGCKTLRDRARGIYEFVIQHMAYDKTVPGWGQGDTHRACLLGKGNCTDFHSLFISMARAERIPARFKIGIVIPEEASGTIPGYHCWAEFYVPGSGWIPVDASEAWKHPERADYYFGAHVPNRFLVSMGRDIRLVPPSQQGTPVNIFFSPYIEVDGRVFPEVRAEVRFQDLQHEEAT